MAQLNRSFAFGDPPGVGGHREWHTLMQNEGYDLSKFDFVAVPEEFSDASGTDQIGHGGLLEYDGVLDVEGSDSDDSSGDPLDGFNVTIEHVENDIHGGEGSGLVHLLEVPSHLSETQQYHKDDILDVGIEACDLKSLLEQFEESEQPQPEVKQVVTPQPEPNQVPQPVPPPTPLPVQKEPTRYKIMTPMKDLPNPADIIKKIAPVKRKAAIMIDPDALPFKKTKPKPVSQNPEINKAINLANRTHAASPIPFNLKNLIPAPKYLSMEHDYCMSPAQSDKSSASDLSNQMSKEQRRAYYKYKYRVKKKFDGVDSPSKCSSVSSSPISLSPASMSPNPAIIEVSDGKVPSASMPSATVPSPAAVVPLFDKIPGYFSKKLLVGMYREIDSSAPSKPVHQGYDKDIFVDSENNNEVGRKDIPQSPTERISRPRVRRKHRRSYRNSRRKNSLSSQSDSSLCSSCSERSHNSEENKVESQTQSRHPNAHVRRRRRTRDSICSARSRSYDSRSPSYSRSRSPSYSSCSDRDSIRRSPSFSRSRSRSFSRSRSRSFSRSPSYSRSRSRSRSYSRSRSRSPSKDYSRRSRSYSRSMSRSPHRTYRSPSRLSRSSRSRSRARSISMSRGRHRSRGRDSHNRSDSNIRTYDPEGDSKEVKYTEEQLQEFEERRVVYVGNIERDVTKRDLMRQFSRFGPVDKIQLYFRENMDNYGFVTYRYKCDAVAAIKAGHDPNWPKYDLCFGGRRKFCMNKYQDLDSLNKAATDLDFGYNEDGERIDPPEEDEPEESEFDKLLKAAMKTKSSKR